MPRFAPDRSRRSSQAHRRQDSDVSSERRCSASHRLITSLRRTGRGCEAAIHAIRSIYENADTDALLLIDAANAFNSLNREAMLSNIKNLCPVVYMYAFNCYAVQARLFVT